jgi:hypothetical protein
LDILVLKILFLLQLSKSEANPFNFFSNLFNLGGSSAANAAGRRGKIGPPTILGGSEDRVKKFFTILKAGLKWIILVLLGVEIFSFLLITATNLLVFNQPWEGSPANYDAYAIFLNADGVQPTLHNPAGASPGTAGKSPRRLWLLGGSTMRGGWVQPGETIRVIWQKF